MPAQDYAMNVQIPLFPLNTVLFPGMRLPLNIFEDRYKLMLKRCLEEKLPFGVVLIRSGEEVGGSAEPFMVGTTARITKVEPTDDGRYLVEAVGEERFRIANQLHRYPYVQAEVDSFPYDASGSSESLAEEVRELFLKFANAALGMTGQWVRSMGLPEDPEELVNFTGARLSAANPVKQQILEAASVTAQLEMERDILESEAAEMESRMRAQLAQRWWSISATN